MPIPVRIWSSVRNERYKECGGDPTLTPAPCFRFRPLSLHYKPPFHPFCRHSIERGVPQPLPCGEDAGYTAFTYLLLLISFPLLVLSQHTHTSPREKNVPVCDNRGRTTSHGGAGTGDPDGGSAALAAGVGRPILLYAADVGRVG